MDEPNPRAPKPSDSTAEEHATQIPVNVNASPAEAGAGPDPEAITPPLPGEVVGGEAGAEPAITPAGMPAAPQPQAPAAPQPPLTTDAPAPPPAQVVTSSHRGGKGRWLKALLLLVIIALLAAGGYYAYQKNHKTTKAAAPAVSKDVPLLRIGTSRADYSSVYPNASDNDYSVAVNMQMFEGLVRYEDTNKIVPNLASTWTNPNNNTWLFTIKKGVKFHDGHTLTPNDVKYSLDKMMNSTSDYAQTFAGTIASTQLVGSDQVKITTKSPDPTLLNKLALLFIIDANLPKGDEPSLAGTGPYEIKPGTTPTDTSYQMVAFDQYHLGRPTTRALSFGSTDTDQDVLKAFNNGQYDIAGSIAPDLLGQAKDATQFHTVEADTNYLGFNTVQAGPLQNKLVREAIRYAVNAEAIGKANDEKLTPVSQLVPPAIPGYNPAITPYKQSIAKAKQLLTQAGYPNGLSLTLTVASLDKSEATEISNELKQVGITVTLKPVDSFDNFITDFSTGQTQLYVVDYASGILDAVDIYNSTLPPANYNNPKVTNLIGQANTTIDPATRLKLLQQVATIVDQDIPVVPLGTTSNTWVMNKPYVIQQDTPTGYLPAYLYTVHLK